MIDISFKDFLKTMSYYGKSSHDEDDRTMPDVDPKAPWWTAGRLPPLDAHYGTGWAMLGLLFQRFHGGEPVVEATYEASLKEGHTIQDFSSSFAESFPDFRVLRQCIDTTGKGEVSTQYIADHGAICIEFDGDSKISLALVTRNQETVDKVGPFFKKNTSKTMPRGRVHVMVSTSDGLEFKNVGVGGQKLERGNYDKEVLAGYDQIVEDLQAASPSGRVSILDGKPGTGKTFLVRGLLEELKGVIFIIVPANLIQQLAQPNMIPALVQLHQSQQGQPMVFLVEDADEVLAPRASDNMSSVSSILNLGDGILGQLLDVRIVCTTNAKHQDIDEAIKRPGRLSAMVHVGPLSPEKAAEVYERLTGKPALVYGLTGKPSLDPLAGKPMFRVNTSLAEVYRLARGDGWKPPKQEQKMGFSSPRGIFEDDTLGWAGV